MIDALIFIAKMLFAWTVMTVGLSWLIACVYVLFSRMLTGVRSENAALLTLVYGLLAPIAATCTLFVMSVPGFAFSVIVNHCHGTVCAPHRVQMSTETYGGSLTVAMIATMLVLIVVTMITQLYAGRRRIQALESLSERGTGSYRLVESRASIAWCAGLFRPQVYLSSGLLEKLSVLDVQIILAHELAHAIRRDNLRKWLFHWTTIFWPRPLKQRARRDFSSYTEQVGDLIAAGVCKGKVDVSGIIRLLNSCCVKSSAHIAPSRQADIQGRIDALERELSPQVANDGAAESGLSPRCIVFSAWMASVALAVHFGHPLLEWLSR